MRSMTGYGKSQNTFKMFEITVEIKSVNNRYIDIMFKLPGIISAFEAGLRETVKDNVSRGKVNVFIDIKEKADDNNGTSLNKQKLMHYFNTLKQIKENLNIPDPIELGHLLQFEELFEPDISTVDEKKFFRVIDSTLLQALKDFNKMRTKEGKHLINDMQKRIEIISAIVKEVSQKAPINVKVEFDKLYNRIEELLGTQKIDRDRLEQEIALISDKVDITEELTRMESHIVQFNHALKEDTELGKKLTFILQEMHREANTMNSKTTDVEISHKVIRIKEEIEKIREQAQNLE